VDITLAKYAVTVTRYFNGYFVVIVSCRLLFDICSWFMLIYYEESRILIQTFSSTSMDSKTASLLKQTRLVPEQGT